jgi:hypothetical protein
MEGRLMDSNERAKRGEGGERAMLGVSAAPVGWIEVGDSGGWTGFPAAMVEELVERGQPGAAPDEQRQEEDRVQALSDRPAHGRESTLAG